VSKLPPNNWNAAVSCLHALGRCLHPQTRLGIFPNTITYHTAILACGKAGRADKALELFHHLLATGPACGVFPTIWTYCMAITACGKAGQADKALEVFDHLRATGPALGVIADILAYNAAMSACTTAGRASEALNLFDQLRVSGPALGIFPDTITYGTAISACEKAGQAHKALEVFEHLRATGPARGVFPNNITYNTAISTYEKAGRADKILELLRDGRGGIFRESFGFDAESNTLDLHERSVLTRPSDPTNQNIGVHSAVARAIFRSLLKPSEVLGEGARGIDEKTEFVVGHRGADTVKDAIAQCMREQGWFPVPPLGLDNLPNLGRLKAQPRGG
jgi:pentatricopeptide repeat protein